MKVNAAILLFLSGSVVASPLAARIARRTRVTRPNIRVNTVPGQNKNSESSNWAGAALVASNFTEVSATFTVPTVQIPSGGDDSTQYCATAWVGIDGDTCQSALLQTGVDFCIQGRSLSYDAWYEWVPADSIDFRGISVSAGDSVSLHIVATSTATGTATITNNSSGQKVSHTFTASETTSTLCKTNAEWIVEDFTQISPDGSKSLAPFANFGTISFKDAYAVENGHSVDATGATAITLTKNGSPLATPSIDGSDVTVSYIGK